jgi:DNA-binding transcriptional ArsR family regulator
MAPNKSNDEPNDKSDDKPDIGRIFHALGDPTRRAIVERLGDGPVTVSQLAAPLQMTLAAVVQHLQVLEESGMVRTEKVGRVRTCRINPKGLDLVQRWVAARRSIWENRFVRLGDLLTELPE